MWGSSINIRLNFICSCDQNRECVMRWTLSGQREKCSKKSLKSLRLDSLLVENQLQHKNAIFRAQNDTLGGHKLPYLSLFGVKETMRETAHRTEITKVQRKDDSKTGTSSSRASLVACDSFEGGEGWLRRRLGESTPWMLTLCKYWCRRLQYLFSPSSYVTLAIHIWNLQFFLAIFILNIRKSISVVH